MRNSRIQQKKLAKRLEILRSAAAAFRAKGFHGASMEDIGSRLLLTKGSLYYYFRNKQELLAFCQNSSLDRLLDLARDAERARLRSDAKLYRLVFRHLSCILDERYGSAAHLELHALGPPALRKILRKRDRYEQAFRNTIEGGIRSGVFTGCDPKIITLAILGAMNWSARWYSPEGALRPEEIAHQFARYLVSGLLAPGVSPRLPGVEKTNGRKSPRTTPR